MLRPIVRGQPIAVLSLGATRRMTIRASQPARGVLKMKLEPGSLLIVSWSAKLHYDRTISKMREPLGSRISMAFRVPGHRFV